MDFRCVICNCEVRKSEAYAIAMYEGFPVPNDYEGEWGGFACCKECYETHQRLQKDRLAVKEWMDQVRNPIEPLNPS